MKSQLSVSQIIKNYGIPFVHYFINKGTKLKAMRTLILTTVTAVLVTTSCAFTTDQNGGSYTAAEEDFISACKERGLDSFSGNENESFYPEVIIVDQKGHIYAIGNHKNEIINKFIAVSDFLTEVQDTAYFLMNTRTEENNSEPLALK
jgi:hypothetical protein